MWVKEPSDQLLIRASSEIGTRLADDFLIQVGPNNESVIKISKAYPYDEWDEGTKTMRSYHSSSLAGVIEFCRGTTLRFIVLFGTREDMRGEPWCDILADEGLSGCLTVDYAFREFQYSDHAGACDRVKSVLRSGDQVSVSVRKGPFRIRPLASGGTGSVQTFTLKVSMLSGDVN
jgi:hypothetical protein